MNKRFEELKRKAVAEADTGHIDFDNMGHTEIQMLGDIAVEKKFAELIVAECIDCLKPLSRNHSMVGAAQDTIREHFGVEE